MRRMQAHIQIPKIRTSSLKQRKLFPIRQHLIIPNAMSSYITWELEPKPQSYNGYMRMMIISLPYRHSESFHNLKRALGFRLIGYQTLTL